jgi:hypothetical protein
VSVFVLWGLLGVPNLSASSLYFLQLVNHSNHQHTSWPQSFEGREVRDVATSVPEDYVAPAAFATLALQHTNVKLTWDKDDDARKRTLAKRVTKDELRDDDFKARIDCPLFIRVASSSLQLQAASTGCFTGSLYVQASECV